MRSGPRLVLMVTVVVTAVGSACATPDISWSHLLVAETRGRSYAELDDVPVRVAPETTPFVGGRALFSPGAVIGLGGRDYEIRFSPELIEHRCPTEGIRYIAAHELAHIADIDARPGTAGLWTVLEDVLLHERDMERRADVITVGKGYWRELIAYRRWQRVRLAPFADTLAEKRRNYFTPNEAIAADDVRRRCPEVYATFRERPPRSLREIWSRCP